MCMCVSVQQCRLCSQGRLGFAVHISVSESVQFIVTVVIMTLSKIHTVNCQSHTCYIEHSVWDLVEFVSETANCNQLNTPPLQCKRIKSQKTWIKPQNGLSRASVWFVQSGLLYIHGGATWQTLWRLTCSLCRYKKLILR